MWRDLWEFFCYGPRGRMNIFVTLTGIAHGGILGAWRYVILTNLGQYVSDLLNFLW